MLASAMILALSLNFYAIAASNAKDEQALREVENGIIAAQTTDQIMQYVDKDMMLYACWVFVIGRQDRTLAIDGMRASDERPASNSGCRGFEVVSARQAFSRPSPLEL